MQSENIHSTYFYIQLNLTEFFMYKIILWEVQVPTLRTRSEFQHLELDYSSYYQNSFELKMERRLSADLAFAQ